VDNARLVNKKEKKQTWDLQAMGTGIVSYDPFPLVDV